MKPRLGDDEQDGQLLLGGFARRLTGGAPFQTAGSVLFAAVRRSRAQQIAARAGGGGGGGGGRGGGGGGRDTQNER